MATRVALFVLCIGLASVRGESLTLLTWNVRNYTTADRQTADGFRPDYPKPEAEKTALREVLRRVRPDVVALQEIGGRPYVEELRRDLGREGLDYPHAESAMGEDTARGLAILSRVPLEDVRFHRDLVARTRSDEDAPGAASPLRRGLLQARVLAPGGAFTLFVVHLKSRLSADRDDPDAENRRVAEAQAARDRILREFPDPGSAAFVIAGDFNDLPGSRTLGAFTSRGRTPIAELSEAADSRGHRWTHAYTRIGLYSCFDHVLISPALRPRLERGRIEDGPEVEAASDHRPVVITLQAAPAATGGGPVAR